MTSIPVVDFSSLSLTITDDHKLNERDVKTTAAQLMDAFTSLGFVYLSNTGFPQQLVLQHKRSFNPLKPSAWCQMVTLQNVQGHTRLTHPFNFFDIRALWRSGLSARVPEC